MGNGFKNIYLEKTDNTVLRRMCFRRKRESDGQLQNPNKKKYLDHADPGNLCSDRLRERGGKYGQRALERGWLACLCGAQLFRTMIYRRMGRML